MGQYLSGIYRGRNTVQQTKERNSYQDIEQASQNQVILANEPLYKLQPNQLLLPIHRVIVAMTVPTGNTINTAYGSGVLLSKNIILTAAHNIYYKKEFVKKIEGKEGNKTKSKVYLQASGLKYYEIEDWRYLEQFTTALKRDEVPFDFALIKLKQTPSLSFSHFLEVCLPCQCILRKEPLVRLNIYGYPKDKGKQSKYRNYEPLDNQGEKVELLQFGLTKKDSIFQIDDSKIKYLVSTQFGQSGSPIIIDEKIIGVHTAGIANKYNFGRLVTKDFIRRITDWCKQLNGDPIRINQSAECPRCKIEVNPLSKQQLSTQQEVIEEANELKKKGDMKRQTYKFEELMNYYTLALEIFERVKGKGCFQSASTLHGMGLAYDSQLNYTKALEYYSLALEIFQRVKGKGCFESADTLHSMGLVYYNQLNYTKALEYYSLALEIRERVKGKGCFQSASTLNNMAMVYKSQLNYTKALEYYSLALEIRERVKGKGCFQSASTLNNMAMVYKSQLNYTKALEYYSLALEIRERVKGKGCFQSASTLNNMAMVYKSQLNYTKALEYYSLALEIREKVKGKGCFQSASTLLKMGLVYSSLNNHEAAVQSFSSSLLIYEKYSRETDARQCANLISELLKKLKKQAQLSQIAAKYGLAV